MIFNHFSVEDSRSHGCVKPIGHLISLVDIGVRWEESEYLGEVDTDDDSEILQGRGLDHVADHRYVLLVTVERPDVQPAYIVWKNREITIGKNRFLR